MMKGAGSAMGKSGPAAGRIQKGPGHLWPRHPWPVLGRSPCRVAGCRCRCRCRCRCGHCGDSCLLGWCWELGRAKGGEGGGGGGDGGGGGGRGGGGGGGNGGGGSEREWSGEVG